MKTVELLQQLIHDDTAIIILSISAIILLYIVYLIIWSQYAIYKINKSDSSSIGNSFIMWQEKRRAKKYHKSFMAEVARREAIYNND